MDRRPSGGRPQGRGWPSSSASLTSNLAWQLTHTQQRSRFRPRLGSRERGAQGTGGRRGTAASEPPITPQLVRPRGPRWSLERLKAVELPMSLAFRCVASHIFLGWTLVGWVVALAHKRRSSERKPGRCPVEGPIVSSPLAAGRAGTKESRFRRLSAAERRWVSVSARTVTRWGWGSRAADNLLGPPALLSVCAASTDRRAALPCGWGEAVELGAVRAGALRPQSL